MYKPTLKEFLHLSKKGNVIPVYKEINADLDTPVSAFLKIKQGDYSFLLESVEGQEKIARYSFLGTNPSLIFKSKGRQIEITDVTRNKTRSFITKETPLEEIKKIMQDFSSVELAGLPRFYGGLVGYIGYDTVRFFEKIPDRNKDALKIPDTVFILTDTILIFDRLNHTLKIVNNVILPKQSGLLKKKQLYLQAIKKIELIYNDFNRFSIQAKASKPSERLAISSNFSKLKFMRMVKKAKEYIKNGDIIQVVLSQRFKVKTQKDNFEIYRVLRSLNPSPYMYYLKLNVVIMLIIIVLCFFWLLLVEM